MGGTWTCCRACVRTPPSAAESPTCHQSAGCHGRRERRGDVALRVGRKHSEVYGSLPRGTARLPFLTSGCNVVRQVALMHRSASSRPHCNVGEGWSLRSSRKTDRSCVELGRTLRPSWSGIGRHCAARL